MAKIGNMKNAALLGAVSATLLAGIHLWEGDKKDPYWDIVGVLTVCSGHTGADIVKNKKYTAQECAEITKKDIIKHQEPVLRCITKPMTRNQYDAFTLFSFNLGGANFCGADFVKKFNAGDSAGACEAMAMGWVFNKQTGRTEYKPVWSSAGGKYVQGLQNRRQFERKLCLGESLKGVPMYDEEK